MNIGTPLSLDGETTLKPVQNSNSIVQYHHQIFLAPRNYNILLQASNFCNEKISQMDINENFAKIFCVIIAMVIMHKNGI